MHGYSRRFGAYAIIHCGKHGNLEWLPGRPVGLNADDWPHLILGPLPHASIRLSSIIRAKAPRLNAEPKQ